MVEPRREAIDASRPKGLSPEALLAWIVRGCLAVAFGYTVHGPDPVTPSLVILLVYVAFDVLAALYRAKECIAYIIFLTTFTFFLLNGPLLSTMRRGSSFLDLHSYETQTHTLFVLFVALFSLDIGHSAWRSRSAKGPTRPTLQANLVLRHSVVRRVSLTLFFFVIPIFAIGQLAKIRFVEQYGYFAYYMSYKPPVPIIFGASDIALFILLVAFLATRPSRRGVAIAAGAYLAGQALAFGYGQRNPFLIACLFVLFYLVVRERESAETGKWLPKRVIWVGLLVLPFLLSSLYVFGQTRVDQQVEDVSIWEGSLNLLEGQGSSSRLIAWEHELHEELSQYGPYVFTPVWNVVKANPLGSWLVGDESGPAASREFATQSGSFADAITYLVDPGSYARGGGLGSSYLAELHQDFGYGGVAIGNVVLGVLLGMSRAIDGRMRSLAVFLIILPSIWYAPRASALSFVYDTLNPVALATLVGVWILTLAVLRRVSRRGARPSSVVPVSSRDLPASDQEPK